MKTSTGEWLAHCGACPVPEVANAFNRAGIKYRQVNGLLGLDYTPEISVTDENTANRPEAIRAWQKIGEWVDAAKVKAALQYCRFGFLGNNYNGMLDLYSDFTMFQAQTGAHVEILEMCDLNRMLETVTEEEVAEKKKEIEEFFIISDDVSADPLAKKPTLEQLDWSARVAVAQEKLVKEYNLDGLAYYYHGAPGGDYEALQSGFIVGHSLLTANGKPLLRGLGVYHGKRGTGVSVEAKVRAGDITTLCCTQTIDGKMKFIITEAESTNAQIMTIGNTQTHVKFKKDPDSYMDEWFAEFPTHHFAMSVGHNASLFEKVADVLGIISVTLDK